jgi:hypothetical protein
VLSRRGTRISRGNKQHPRKAPNRTTVRPDVRRRQRPVVAKPGEQRDHHNRQYVFDDQDAKGECAQTSLSSFRVLRASLDDDVVE